MYAEVLRTQNNTGTYIYDYVLFQPLSFVVSKLFLFGCFSTKKWLSSWWFQPNWNNIKVVKFDHFPNFRGEHKKSLSCHHLDNMYAYIYMLYIYINTIIHFQQQTGKQATKSPLEAQKPRLHGGVSKACWGNPKSPPLAPPKNANGTTRAPGVNCGECQMVSQLTLFLFISQQMKDRYQWHTCWWFRNPKQPPGMYQNLVNKWDLNYLSLNGWFPDFWTIHRIGCIYYISFKPKDMAQSIIEKPSPRPKATRASSDTPGPPSKQR